MSRQRTVFGDVQLAGARPYAERADAEPPSTTPSAAGSDAVAAPGLRECDCRLVGAVPLAAGVTRLSFELY